MSLESLILERKKQDKLFTENAKLFTENAKLFKPNNNQNRKYIGYWAIKGENSMPWDNKDLILPIENSKTADQTDIINKFKAFCKNECKTEQYLGFSECRICGCNNGSIEYYFKKMILLFIFQKDIFTILKIIMLK
jgi:hypothetical protein